MNQRKAGTFGFVCLLATVALLGCTNLPNSPGGKPVPAETPVFDSPAGTYPQAVEVTISSATAGATIYYTTDNTAPSDTNGTVYTTPIRITATTTLKAIAYKDGLLASLTATATYTIGATPPADNKLPVFDTRSLLGVLVAGESTSVALTCTVTDDGSVESVTADLRAIGGSAAHALAHVSGDLWAWSGTVLPAAAGQQTITFTAADNYGAKATATLVVDVLASLPAGQEKWHFATKDWVWSSPALAADGTVYVGSLDGNVYAVKPDGSQKWVFKAGSYVYSSPAVGGDGTVYVGSRDFKLYAIAPDGSKRWEYAGLIDASPAIGADGTIYIGSVPDGGITSLYAINPDGTAKWQFATNGAIWSSPAVGADGTIYFGARDYCVYAVDSDGHRKWQFYANDQVDSSPAIAADGTVYVGCRNGNLHALNSKGLPDWSLDLASPINSSPAIGTDGTIYVGCGNGNLYAVDPGGVEKWHFATGGAVDSSPLVGSDGTVYVGSRDGSFYAVSPDGLQVWSFATAGQIISSPVISPSGTLYFGSYDGNLYAVGASGTLAGSNWPMFRRGLQHTARVPSSQPANQPPQFDSVSASIDQQVTQPGSLMIACQVSDPDDSVVSVTADLSALGVSGEQALIFSDGQWTWSGNVPFVAGTTPPVQLTAADSHGGVTTTTVVPSVTTNNNSPTISNVSVLPNPLTQDMLATLMVSCTAVDPETTVASVEIDTSAIDGAIGWHPMIPDGTGGYSHYDYVIPTATGQVYITIRATDDMGAASTYSFPITINPAPVPQVSVIAATTYPAPAITGQRADVILSCSVTPAPGRFIGGVNADLSAFGGSSAEPMLYDTYALTWSVSANCLMPGDGSYQVRLTASDDLGFQGFADATITVAPQPQIASITSTALTRGQAATATITLTTTDAVMSVQVDVTPLGGSVDLQSFASANGTDWAWTGSLTPPASGSIAVPVTLGAGLSGTFSNTININVAAPPTPPAITSLSASTTPDPALSGQSATISVGCTTTPFPGHSIASVTADLSPFEGGIVPLQFDTGAGRWSVNGSYTMPAPGTYAVHVLATDDAGLSSSDDTSIIVNAAPPRVLNVTYGPLYKGMPATATITCATTVDVLSVGANLLPLGGPSTPQMFDPAGTGMWTWTGPLYPQTSGDISVDMTLTTSAGSYQTTIAIAVADAFGVIPISTMPGDQVYPATSGNVVVWEDHRAGNGDIYGFNLATGTPLTICTDLARQQAPATDGTWVVWQDDRNGTWDIYAYNLSTMSEQAICTDLGWQANPAVSGNIVVWQDDRNGTWDIYAYDLSAGREFAICTAPGNQTNPRISGNTVVWQDMRNSTWDIYGYDLSGSREFAICTAPGNQTNPQISGDTVVWQDMRNGTWDIYGYDLSAGNEVEVCVAAGQQAYPTVSSNLVVWQDNRTGPWDIQGRVMPSGQEFVIHADPAMASSNPAATTFVPNPPDPTSATYVVWHTYTAGTFDILGTIVPGASSKE